MRSSLDHLPAGKRHELAFVVEVLREGFTAAMAKREPAEAALDHVLKIILFGSYARGDWVEDPVGRYFSDYDLLVVVDEERLTESWEIWEGAEKRLLSALSSGARLRTPVNFIVHTLEDVNQQLEHGRSFFIDIVRDGVSLLELPYHPLVEPKALAPETALAEAQARLSEQMAAADEFMLASNFLRERNATKRAVFIAHQAVESLYTCLLLVMTLYTPKSHNLVRLRKLVEPLDFRLAEVWPTSTKSEKRCFEKLRAAYVKGRYSRHYEITAEELAWIAGRVAVLQALVRDICEARLEELRAQINQGPVGDADIDGQSSSSC